MPASFGALRHLGAAGVVLVLGCCGAEASESLPVSPADAQYEVGGELVQLHDGLAEQPAAPGAASKKRTALLGDPLFGDLEGDGDEDAVLWLVQETGGSGTFHYLAAALREGEGFRGTRAVRLGDRIAPKELSIHSRVVTAHFADRGPGEPMAAQPTLAVTAYFLVQDRALAPVGLAAAEGDLLHGWLAASGEAMTFTPCGEAPVLRLAAGPRMLQEIRRRYRTALPEGTTEAPVFASLLGHRNAAAGELGVVRLLQTWPSGNCISDRVILETPRPGTRVGSPLSVRGKAKGAWFFEGEVKLRLRDGAGAVLATGFATAQDEWMTQGFVPFEGSIAFESPPQVREILLVVERNNPSENRALDESLEVPLQLE